MSELNQVIRLIRVAREREASQDFNAAEAAWEAARRANAKILRANLPLFEVRSLVPVASTQLDSSPPGWFTEDKISPTPQSDLDHRTMSPAAVGEYRSPPVGERLAGIGALAAGIWNAVAGEPEDRPSIDINPPAPKVTIGGLIGVGLDVLINGRQEEIHRVSPLTDEEIAAQTNRDIAAAVLAGTYQPEEPQTEGDRRRRDAFLDSAEKYGTAHVLGSSMFDW